MRHKNPELKQKILDFIGEFYRVERRAPSFSEIGDQCGTSKVQAYRYVLEMREEGLLEYDGQTIRTNVIEKCKSPARISAPVVGKVGCGDPMTEEENIEEYVNLPESIFGEGEFYILHTYGDSMLDAGIEPGSLVVVDRTARPKKGDIVVVLNGDNENTLKQYRGKKRGKYVFAYMNEEDYPDETIELDSFVCQGVVRHLIKSF